MAGLDIFNTYTLMAILERVKPVPTFFKSRYFPTSDGDIFASDKVLVEVQKDGERIAPFVSRRAGDVPLDRDGYSVHEFQPAYIAPSRLLTLDDLEKRGFGEALFSNSSAEQRAALLQQRDLTDLDKAITRREEWMCAQTMINNACEMQTYADGEKKGEKLYVKFFNEKSEHTYTVANKWDDPKANIRGDVIAMCNMLIDNGLPAEDLVLGADAYEAVLADPELREIIKTFSGINAGAVNEQLTSYPGVTYAGKLNFGGNILNVFCVRESVLSDGKRTPLFPADAAMVTFPGCGHTMYGQIAQIDYGTIGYTSHAATRVPKFTIDQANDVRKLRLAARPLPAPINYCPYIYAAKVTGSNP